MSTDKRKLTLKKVFYNSLICEHQVNIKRPYPALRDTIKTKLERMAQMCHFECKGDRAEKFYEHLQYLARKNGWYAEIEQHGFAQV